MWNFLHPTIKRYTTRRIEHFNKYKKHYIFCYFWWFAVVKMILVFIGLFSAINIYNTTFAAGTTLSVGDIVIVSTNATDPDSFEFFPRRDLVAGTTIYFTDNAWSENNTRRSTEWTIKYTSPWTIPAGTVISFIAWYETTYPTIWESSWSFLFSTAWDNIFIYQWTTYNDPNPNFIYGIGWWIATPRITSGSPTANNSYIPTSLTPWTTLLTYTPWTHKNIQYGCFNQGILSNNFLSTISNVLYRSWSVSTRYSPISCTFDAVKPQISIDLADGQNDPTSWSVIKFLVTFSEPITTWDFTCSDIWLVGTVATKTCETITEISPNNGTRFEITVHTTNNGFLRLEIEPEKVTDIAGNPNDWPTVIDDSVTINITPPQLSEITPIATPSSNTTPNYTFRTNEEGSITYWWSCTSSTTVANPWNNTITLDTLIDGTYTDCTIVITDELWSVSAPLSISSFTIDTSVPFITETIPVNTPTNNTTPNYTFSTHESWLQILYDGGCTSTTTNTLSWANTITFESLSEWTYNNCVISIIDWIGNTGILHVRSFTIDTLAPIISEINSFATPTEDTTPEYTFTTNETGNIIYWWSCTSSTTVAMLGNNTIILNPLTPWSYSDCSITVSDWASNVSNTLSFSPFIITISPSWNDWWWGIVLHIDNCPYGDESSSYYDGTCAIENDEHTIKEYIPEDIETYPVGIETDWHATANTQRNNRTLNRKTLAKFLVFFAKDILHLTPDTKKSCIFIDTKNETPHDQLIIQHSCQLDLMWLQQNGTTTLETFRPLTIITHEEFITTLSRLIFNNKNNISLSSSLNFYSNHALALQNIDLLQNIPANITQAVVVDILKTIYNNPNIIERE